MSWVLREIVSYSWDSFFFSFKKTRLLIKVDDEYIIKIIAMTIHSFKFWQTFFLLRQQSGRVKRHAYSYVFLLRPPLPKARSRGGRQFFFEKIFDFLNNIWIIWSNIYAPMVKHDIPPHWFILPYECICFSNRWSSCKEYTLDMFFLFVLWAWKLFWWKV